MVDAAKVNEVADRLFAAFSGHDYDAARVLFAPDARAWTNATGTEQDVDGLLAFLPMLKSVVGDHSYSDVRRVVGPDGFAEQHRVTSVRADGSTLDLGDVAVIATLDPEGLVTRLDEYIDTLLAKNVLS